MEGIVKILAVAPYEGLAAILEREARSYANVQMSVVVGNLDEGVAAAIEHLVEPFDLILSRGGTADLLREALDLPVVDIKTSAYDVLQAVQLSQDIKGRRAVVGFSGITDAARGTADVLQLDLDIFTLVDEDDAHAMVELLRRGGYTTVLCDVISSTVFRENGFNTVLVTSSARSVQESIEEAVRIAHDVGSAHAENLFLREVLRMSEGDTVIYHENGSLFFTTLDRAGGKALLDTLKALLPETLTGNAEIVRRSVEGRSYTIRSIVRETQGERMAVFYLSQASSTSVARQAGVTYLTRADARKEYLESPFSLTGTINDLRRVIEGASESGRPLLITGEYGTGRTAVADYVYSNSRLASHPLVEIDCGMLTERSKANLLGGRTSPLFENDLTIHIKNMDAADESFITELFSTMATSNVCRRNAVIFSCNPYGELVSARISYIKDKFQCMEASLPPLREDKERIPTLARLYLSQLSADLPREVQRIDRQAMELLADYAWPGNYIQFGRILSQLCVVSRDHVVRAQDVRSALALERPVYPAQQQTGGYGMDLDRTLAEIEADIVSMVLDQNGGNQSAAARQLGISRTTLWRMVKARES